MKKKTVKKVTTVIAASAVAASTMITPAETGISQQKMMKTGNNKISNKVKEKPQHRI